MSERLRPLLPRVRLRVGVTGHRLGSKLPTESIEAIKKTVGRMLADIAASAREVIGTGDGGLIDTAVELVVVSALAEGADRIVAEAGLDKNYALDVVLPFEQDEYLRDFESADSREEFGKLIAKASAVLELDGERAQANRAYEAAGLVMLANCDLLIAIWDQNEAAGIGGTALIADRAANESIPIVVINPAQPERATLLWAGDMEVTPARVRMEDMPKRDAFAQTQTKNVVKFLIAPPDKGAARSNLATYLGEKERHWSLGPWYALLLWLFGNRKMRQSDFYQEPYLASTREQWADYLKIAQRTDRLSKAIDQILLPAFAAADNLSIHFARAYRDLFVVNYVAAALVATLAVMGLVVHYHEMHTLVWFTELIELVIIAAVLLAWAVGHSRQWHRRWMEYRRLAECLRHMRLIALTASVGPITRPGKLPEGDDDWVDWYARAIRRLLPLPRQVVDSNYIATVRSATCEAELKDQIEYHNNNIALMNTLDHHLHLLGYCFFGATAVALIVLLSVPARDMHAVKSILIVLTVALPIFGSAFNAISAHGDFKMVAKRSQQTLNRLTAVRDAISNETLSFARLADRVETASDIMMDELTEWQLVFRTRPLSLPV